MKYPSLLESESFRSSRESSYVHNEITRGPLRTRFLARPIGFPSILNRFRYAWGVFIGRYDAVRWGGGQ